MKENWDEMIKLQRSRNFLMGFSVAPKMTLLKNKANISKSSYTRVVMA
jgi:hypothetical protein